MVKNEIQIDLEHEIAQDRLLHLWYDMDNMLRRHLLTHGPCQKVGYQIWYVPAKNPET